MKIHPTAVVHPKAEIGAECEIGPYCVVGEHVVLGAGCRLHSHVVIDGRIAEIFDLQDKIVYELSQGLNLSLNTSEINAIEHDETQSVEAYEQFSRGMMNLRTASRDAPLPAPECHAHSCTPLMWKRRIRTTATGINTGKVDMTAATASAGRPELKA